MMRRIGFFLFTLVVLSSTVFAQRVITCYTADSSMKAKTFINRSDAVDSIHLRGLGEQLVYRKLPLPPNIKCTPYKNLMSDCASLNLPIISTVTQVSDSMVVFKGIFSSNALCMKHLILVNPHTGKLIDWLAFIADRGEFNVAFSYLEAEKALILSKAENRIVNDLIYRVHQPKQSFDPISMSKSTIRYFSSGIAEPFGQPNPVLRGDYFYIKLP